MKQLMKSMEVHPMRLLVGACSLGLVLSLSQMGVAQQTAAPAKAFTPVAFSALAPGASQSTAKPAGEEEEETSKPQKPGTEGVKVHGHWVIDVRNSDGKVVEHRDFQNSLVTSGSIQGGDWVIAQALSGEQTPGGLSVAFVTVDTTANTDASEFCDGTVVGACYIFTAANNIVNSSSSTFAHAAKNIESGLVSTLVPAGVSGTNPNGTLTFVLSGNYSIPAGLSVVNAVQTYLSLCSPQTSSPVNTPGFVQADLAASKCIVGQLGTDTAGFLPMTSTTITTGGVVTPLTVTTGQIIQVTVTLSFS